MKKIIVFVATLLLAFGAANAQELQLQYDFNRSKDAGSPYTIATITGTHFDNWGSTFYFVNFDFAKSSGKTIYGEIQRALNFWQNTALKDFYLEVEYDGGVLSGVGGDISQAFLAGAAYSFHDETFRNFLQLQVLYRQFFGNTFGNPHQDIPIQLTAVYTLKDLFNVKDLLLVGFADFWWQDGFVAGKETNAVFMAKPQLWYGVGKFIGVDNLHIGGQVEITANCFSTEKHWVFNPAVGVRWTL